MSSDHEISKKVTKLLLDIPKLQILKPPPTNRPEVEKASLGCRVRPYTIFLLASALFLQMMSAQLAQPDLAKSSGILSIVCFAWGSLTLFANDAGHPSLEAALAQLFRKKK